MQALSACLDLEMTTQYRYVMAKRRYLNVAQALAAEAPL